MSETKHYDLVIVGGGPGGLTAGIYAKRAALKTVLVEKGVPGGQVTLSDEVENYPGFIHVTGAELSAKFAQHAEALDLEIVSDEVTAIQPGMDYHTVRLSGGLALKTHAVIMAMGGNPRKLGVPGEDEYYGKGVSYCAVCDGFFFRDKTVVVVGGGDSAAEEALYLAKITKKVYMVHRRDALRAGMILQERIKSDCKIEMVWNTVVKEVKANAAGVCAAVFQNIRTGETREVETDGVFVFVGFIPNNALVPAGVKLNAEGYVITDEKCETRTPGIFAIGDLREKYARQIVIAAADGCTAALAAAHLVETKKASPEFCELPPGFLE
jgi:thioredoxin reductase (NADPH)